MRFLIFILSISFCYAQSNPTLTVSDFTTNKQVKISVRKSEVKGPPVVNIGPSPYGSEVTTLWTEDDTTYFTYITLIYINYQSDTIKIKAVNFSQQFGTTDSGGFQGVKTSAGIVEYFNAGDWLKYNVNLTGKKEIVLRWACQTATNSKLEIRKDSMTGEKVAEMPSESTGSWTTWKQKVLPILINTTSTGGVDLYFVISGTGYWGNLERIEFR